MKARIFTMLLCAAAFVSPVLAQDIPVIKLQYWSLPFDPACEELTMHRHNATNKGGAWRIEAGWRTELNARVAEFQTYWDSEGPKLLRSAFAEVARPFPHREMIATLTLCDVMSMSNPLIINMRRFLEGPSNGKPLDGFLFGSLVLHELLHTYVVAHRSKETPILKEYKDIFDKFPIARNHVHLYAIMKVVYEKLGRHDELKAIIDLDSTIPRPGYKLAWELVQKIGADRLVAELKAQ